LNLNIFPLKTRKFSGLVASVQVPLRQHDSGILKAWIYRAVESIQLDQKTSFNDHHW